MNSNKASESSTFKYKAYIYDIQNDNPILARWYIAIHKSMQYEKCLVANIRCAFLSS